MSIICNFCCYCIAAFFCLALIAFLSMRYLFSAHLHSERCAYKLQFSLFIFMIGNYFIIKLLVAKRSYSNWSFVRTTHWGFFSIIYMVSCYRIPLSVEWVFYIFNTFTIGNYSLLLISLASYKNFVNLFWRIALLTSIVRTLAPSLSCLKFYLSPANLLEPNQSRSLIQLILLCVNKHCYLRIPYWLKLLLSHTIRRNDTTFISCPWCQLFLDRKRFYQLLSLLKLYHLLFVFLFQIIQFLLLKISALWLYSLNYRI